MNAPPTVAPTWELSGWWRRVGASVIDALILTAASAIPLVIFIFAFVDFDSPDEPFSDSAIDGIGLAGVFLMLLLIPTVYYCWMMSATNGQTVGKQALNIRVVREDGQAVTAVFAFIRQILVINILFGFILGFFFFGLPQLVDYLWPLWDSKNQALHDKIVKSRVVMAEQVVPDQYGPPPPQPYFTPGQQGPPVPPAPGQPYYGQYPPQPGQSQAPFPQGNPAPPPPPPSAPPPPPPPGGTSTPYTPPPGFDNPVPDDDKS